VSTNGNAFATRTATPGRAAHPKVRSSALRRRSCKTPVGHPRGSRYTRPNAPRKGSPDASRRFPLIPSAAFRAALSVALLAALPALAATTAPAKDKPAASASTAAKQPELTILYGDDHAFGIVVPSGWTVDDTSGIGSKIRVVLYPKGQAWATAPNVMYVNPLHQKQEQRRTLRQMIEQDIADFRKQAPHGSVSTQPPLETALGQPAEVRYFARDGGAPTEAVAYVAEDQLVMLLVLQSRDNAGFQKNLPAFRSLVAGYRFVIGGIQTPK
jgi:hypothetical protein